MLFVFHGVGPTLMNINTWQHESFFCIIQFDFVVQLIHRVCMYVCMYVCMHFVCIAWCKHEKHCVLHFNA
jgi:hypothetical protein